MARLKTLRSRLSGRTSAARLPIDPKLSSTARGYDARWQRYRKEYLAANPLCRFCAMQGEIKLAVIVDHIIPHRGDKELFWDQRNHQGLCKFCHDSTKQKMEKNPTTGG